MKKIFFHIGAPSPILETELELIKISLKDNDDIHFVKCVSELKTCFFNRNKIKSFCKICQLKVDSGIKLIDKNNKIKIHELKTKEIRIKIPKFKNIEQLKKFKFDSFEVGYGVASSLLSHELDHRPNLIKLTQDINKKILSSLKIYYFFKDLIKKIKPNKVYIFNGRISDTWPLICLCEKFKIKYCTYEVAAHNKYRIIENSTPHLIQTKVKPPKNYLQKNLKTKIKLANNYIFNKDKYFKEIGLKNFNVHPKSKIVPIINHNKKNISIFPSRLDEFESIKGLKNKIYKPDDTAGIEKILNSFKNNSNFFFYIRLHPSMKHLSIKSTQMRDVFEIRKKYKNAFIIWPESKVDSYELIKRSDKVVTFGSTLTIEACFMKKPVISLNNNLFTQLNCAYTPKNHLELINLIKNKTLKPKNWKNSLYFFDYYTNRGEKFKFFRKIDNKILIDGKSINVPKIEYFKYGIEQIVFKIRNFKISNIEKRIINSYFYKKIFIYK